MPSAKEWQAVTHTHTHTHTFIKITHQTSMNKNITNETILDQDSTVSLRTSTRGVSLSAGQSGR